MLDWVLSGTFSSGPPFALLQPWVSLSGFVRRPIGSSGHWKVAGMCSGLSALGVEMRIFRIPQKEKQYVRSTDPCSAKQCIAGRAR